MKNFEKITAVDHGIAVRGGSPRGIAAVGKAPEHEAVVVWLMDEFNYRLLQIDIETGVCDCIFVPFENPNAVYASLRNRAGKCYSLFGYHFVEYDPRVKQFTFVQRVPSLAAMAMEEDSNGEIRAVTYPDCALYSFVPETQLFISHGVLKKENWQQYPRSLVAAPDGWLYAGIGLTAGNIIAYNCRTSEIRELFSESERPRPAMFSVCKGDDGGIYGVHNGSNSFYKLENGQKKPCRKPETALRYHDYSGDQDLIIPDFPSGRTLNRIDLAQGELEILEKDGTTRRTVSFSFENSGAVLMSLDVNSEGIAAGGGFFPFYFGTLDPVTGARTNERADVQCNTILACDKYFYIGGYCGGQIMRYDPSRPWTLREPMKITEPDLTGNPLFYGRCSPHINRPHCLAVTPDGRTLAMGGTPDYGMTGGGLALLDTHTGKLRLIPHTELAENEAPFALAALSDRHLLAGTTIAPGTGGEVKAESASLLLLELPSGRVLWRSKAPGKIDSVTALLPLPGGDAIGIGSDLRMFRFELAALRVVPGASAAGYGALAATQGARILLRDEEDIWLLFKSGAGKIDPRDGAVTAFYPVTPEIRTGGAVRNGVLYYSGSKRWCSVDLRSHISK